MKNTLLAFAFLFSFSLMFTACGDGTPPTEVKTETTPQPAAKDGKEYTSAYVCPMHCAGSGSAEPGKCPVCKMDYVANEKAATDHDGHDHDGNDHSGHNH